MPRPSKKPAKAEQTEQVFREFAWNVAGAITTGKAGTSSPPRKPAPGR